MTLLAPPANSQPTIIFRSEDCLGLFLTTRAFVQGMIDQKSGRIINISSIVGQTGFAMGGHRYPNTAGLSRPSLDQLDHALRGVWPRVGLKTSGGGCTGLVAD